jgi:UDP-GlcNAc:undecaprenyl-phosphate/decaprenyl-phosphate GlcNAc-1-phosphate transferase
MLELGLVFAVAVAAGLGLTPLVIRAAAVWGIYDAPHGDRRVHTEPLPRLGGIAVFGAMGIGLVAMALGSLVGLSFFSGPPGFFFGLLFGGGIIFATGLIDDVRGLRPSAKLTAQVVAALVVYAYGFRIDLLSIGPTAEFSVGWLSLPLTVVWIVGVTNAFNLIDGLDGLATGIAVVALGTTTVVASVLGNAEVMFLCFALLGALIGFLRFNFSPARIFLGDSGSLFIGFMLAVLSVYGSVKSATAVMIIVPLFALAVPLGDTALAIVRRWLRGVPFSEADGRHIHHRLLAAGLTHKHAVIVLYAAATVLAVLGLSLVLAPPPAVISIAAAGGGVTLLILLYGLRRLQYHEFVEAGSVLISGLGRARRVIRDQIYARDIAALIRQAPSVEKLISLLEDHATTFGFLHMEVCREDSPGKRPLVLFNGRAARAWKLDYPVAPHDFVEGDDFVLRIWCNPRTGSRPYGAERVAQILAPVIEERLTVLEPRRAAARVHASIVGGISRAEAAEAPIPDSETRIPHRLERLSSP